MDALPLTIEDVFRLAPDGKAAQAAMALVAEAKLSQLRVAPDGRRLAGVCRGSGGDRYQVQVDLAAGANTPGLASCSCPSTKHPCKHALGLLIAYVRAPEQFATLDFSPPRDAAPRAVRPKREPTPAARLPSAAWDQHTAAFLAAVLQTPEDDVPRLVFSDWLEEQGEADRAEFIRLQCERARLPADDPRADAVAAREAALWKKHEKAWKKPLPVWLLRMKPVFRRGFVEEVSVKASLYLKYADALAAAAPVLSLRLSDLDGYASALAAQPHLARVRSLCLFGDHVSNASLKQLLNTPFLRGLRRLTLSHLSLGTRGAQALAETTFLDGLEELDLQAAGLGPAAAHYLADGPPFARLRALDLRGNRLGNDGARALAASKSLPAGLVLHVADCDIGPVGMKRLDERFPGTVRR